MTLEDRQKEIYNTTGNLSMCQTGCEFESYNKTTKKVNCNCNAQTNTTEVDITKIDFTNKRLMATFLIPLISSNFLVLKCYKLAFSTINLFKNIGRIIMTIIYIIFILSLLFYIIKDKKKISMFMSDILINKNNIIKFSKKNVNSKPEKKNNKILNDNKIKKNKNNENSHKQDKKKTINEKEEKRKKYNKEKLDITKKNKDKNIFQLKNKNKSKEKNKKNEPPLKKRNNIKNNNDKFNSSDKPFISNLNLNSKKTSNKININIIPINNFNYKKNKNKSNIIIKNKDTNNKKKTKTINKMTKINNNKDYSYFNYRNLNDQELNTLKYILAIKYDKRTYLQYYWSLLKKKHLILFTFLPSNDYNLFSLKLSLFLLSFSLYFTINGFFFTDNTMHKIHVDNGAFNIIYQIPQILYSSGISAVINMILKMLSLSENNILSVKKLPNIKSANNKYKSAKECITTKFILFFILSNILLLFFWYFITCFCAVYLNTQIILIKDTMMSFGLSMVYPFGLNLLPGMLRLPALRNKNESKKCLYKISTIVALI